MPAKKHKQINLLPKEQFEGTIAGRILKWALSTFRIMVIVTEIVVMGAFLSRFWLDARNSDLNEEISVSKSQILAYQKIEEDFRFTQKRIDIAKSLYNQKDKYSETVGNISKTVPSDILLSSIASVDSTISIKANTFSERAIAQFIVNLDSLEVFDEINLNQISTSKEDPNALTFTLSTEMKGEK